MMSQFVRSYLAVGRRCRGSLLIRPDTILCFNPAARQFLCYIRERVHRFAYANNPSRGRSLAGADRRVTECYFYVHRASFRG